LKAGVWFRRGRLFMVSPVHGDYYRGQAETPLIDLFKFAEPALATRYANASRHPCLPSLATKDATATAIAHHRSWRQACHSKQIQQGHSLHLQQARLQGAHVIECCSAGSRISGVLQLDTTSLPDTSRPPSTLPSSCLLDQLQIGMQEAAKAMIAAGRKARSLIQPPLQAAAAILNGPLLREQSGCSQPD
ncbi:hypothetical protein QCM80_42855, partial [Bradyrhizobium sp. SSUT112]|uniref:hypothetical protein n=1 Tax=Bradyrhizobium sp. SSUT112 TaxID=3040604 RepID=UPI002449EC9B